MEDEKESEILEISLEDKEIENHSVKSETQDDDFYVGEEMFDERDIPRETWKRKRPFYFKSSKKSKYNDSKSEQTLRIRVRNPWHA